MGFIRGKNSGGPTNVTKMSANPTRIPLATNGGGRAVEPNFFEAVGQGIADGASAVGGFLFGDANDPGIFGTGRREVDPNAGRIPGAEGFAAQLAAGAASAGQRAAPTVGDSAFRGGQEGLVAALQAQAAGQGPSLAQGQLRQATDRNLAQAIAMAQTVGGNNPGAIRNLANQRAAIGQQAAADASQLRLTEQMQAQNQLGQVLAGARGQDIALGSENARLAQQQTALNDSLTQFYLSQGLSLAQAQQQAALQLEGLRTEAYYGTAGGRRDFGQGLLEGIGRVAGLGAGA